MTDLDKWLSEWKAAKLLGYTTSYLARLRISKAAPNHTMFRGDPYYTRREIMRWLRTNKKKK